MKKLAFLTYEFPPEMATGGIGSYTNNICNLLKDYDFKVHVFSATLNQIKEGKVIRSNCVNHLIYATSHDMFRNKLLSVFSKEHDSEPFDVMESPEVGACGIEVKKKYPDIPLIVKLHSPGVLITKISRTYQSNFEKFRFVLGSIFRLKPSLGYWANKDKRKEKDIEYKICNLADKLISPSVALKNWISQYWDLNKCEINIVPNPYPIKERSLIDTTLKNKVILFVGKLTTLKGMVAFSKAIPAILSNYPDYTIKLVGRDEYDSYFKCNMKDYMLQQIGKKHVQQVEFVGVISNDEVNQLFRTSSLAIFPSLWENYPTVVLEAMANGCPVIAANAGGFPEIIKQDENGKLFNPYKPSEIFKSVSSVLSSSRKLNQFSDNGLNTIENMQKRDFLNKIIEPYKLST